MLPASEIVVGVFLFVVFIFICRGIRNKIKRTEEPQAAEALHAFGISMKISDLFLSLFTAILALATVFLYYATDKLAKGEDSTAVKQLRAYVFIDVLHIENYKPGKVPFCTASMRNFGKTPAIKITVSSRIYIGNVSDAGEVGKGLAGNPTPPIPAGDVSSQQTPLLHTLTESDINDLTEPDRAKAVICTMHVSYKDIFQMDRYTERTVYFDFVRQNPIETQGFGNKTDLDDPTSPE